VRNLPAFYAVALIQYSGLDISVFDLRRRRNVPSTNSRPKKRQVCQNKTLKWTVMHTFTSKDTETETLDFGFLERVAIL
jgi:hypothetical protein